MRRRISIDTLEMAEVPFDRHVAGPITLGAAAISPGSEEVIRFGFAESVATARSSRQIMLAFAATIGAETITHTPDEPARFSSRRRTP